MSHCILVTNSFREELRQGKKRMNLSQIPSYLWAEWGQSASDVWVAGGAPILALSTLRSVVSCTSLNYEGLIPSKFSTKSPIQLSSYTEID